MDHLGTSRHVCSGTEIHRRHSDGCILGLKLRLALRAISWENGGTWLVTRNLIQSRPRT